MPVTRDQVVAKALTLLDEKGLDGLTLRMLAERLGIRAPTLYWHVKDKADLIEELGETILVAGLANLPDPEAMTWQDWLVEAAAHFRLALLTYRDGARIAATAQGSPSMAAFAERAMAVLVKKGVPLRRARLLVLLIERFTLGLVLEEQSEPRIDSTADPAELAARYPTLTAAVKDYFSDGATLDDLYRDSIRLITNPN